MTNARITSPLIVCARLKGCGASFAAPGTGPAKARWWRDISQMIVYALPRANSTGKMHQSTYCPNPSSATCAISMFCAFPTNVAAAPMLLAIANAMRNGTGFSRRRSRAMATTGAKTKQTMSLLRNADNPAVTAINTSKNRAGLSSRAAMLAPTLSKKPESRSCADSTKNPNNNRMVGQLMNPITSLVGRPEKIMIAIAPSNAMPVRSSFNLGTRPTAMPR